MTRRCGRPGGTALARSHRRPSRPTATPWSSSLLHGLFVARLVLCIGWIQARQRRALFHLVHDPTLEPLLLRRGGDDFIEQGRRDEDRAVIVDNHHVVG